MSEMVAGEGKKKREMLGPPPFGAPPFEVPPFGAPPFGASKGVCSSVHVFHLVFLFFFLEKKGNKTETPILAKSVNTSKH